ncbi:MAG: DUF4124 domain-containing protein [Candidatus Binatia bacterium]|nr:DUF4124 domain-containing protein [Candidatus Binatia bacterium]
MNHCQRFLRPALCVVLLASASVALAQRYYKWTDERGVVHFSDHPPAGRQAAEERVLPPRPAATDAPTQPPAEAAAAATPQRAQSGAARVVIAKQEVERLTPNSIRVSGELRNTGGSEARRVVLVVKATDAVQGNPCLEREISPAQDTLAPEGSTGFEAEITDPCLYGEPPVELAVRWE